MKLFLYFCAVVFALILLRYLIVIVKRAVLLAKIGKAAKKSGGRLIFARCRFSSVFVHDLRTDFILEKNGERFEVAILTTPFKRFRYHFTSKERLKIVMLRRGVMMINPRTPRSPSATVDRAFTVWRYKISLPESDVPPERAILLIHPAPREFLVTNKTAIDAPSNGEVIFGRFTVCFGKYFREHYI